ncbi:hypothetical protein A2334_04365 [Candidatus Roizmanbacteria bacterium RIFOXYB2_FULL_38_10]|uniref:Uncharacterized protein n=1 Tax=Candidatus Roizmanbacteria bacterium RIFOXYD1_FULL_38_12 TaxID=1802093 RepID=A0A1F7KZE6_9BACT|nr:MAG: hypothetical protein A3K47_00475 [Candidatus Roizmanbacteria bacterium RIFOXYA2_FULL_38_14]OGK63269.1 MAG: hypothetical protein A3K27_00475 [Candidatus Roizmanbacteria bacterium RIFOXYA1_FULL_37_12]OGK65115.1 MAG: hypothetical protein A3K38_00475 [Candidatus Roizmanbacteria bacterium RIFOXYB1_FULL_40_23]OGK68669.1 MAG: hypothetical protein A2334_04365 [Candidatus Roizmanbacteria bacterium RIFOXYB2_FULL_38_10]OGK69519.1 MAG: hypothetical protein A3K21_00475 [Candidatus Roizmanbacteria ba
MKKKYSNPCTRCGTERIVSRIWKEKLDNSTIINTDMICPNPACQKQVVEDNKRRTDKYAALKRKSEQRAVDRKATLRARKMKK